MYLCECLCAQGEPPWPLVGHPRHAQREHGSGTVAALAPDPRPGICCRQPPSPETLAPNAADCSCCSNDCPKCWQFVNLSLLDILVCQVLLVVQQLLMGGGGLWRRGRGGGGGGDPFIVSHQSLRLRLSLIQVLLCGLHSGEVDAETGWLLTCLLCTPALYNHCPRDGQLSHALTLLCLGWPQRDNGMKNKQKCWSPLRRITQAKAVVTGDERPQVLKLKKKACLVYSPRQHQTAPSQQSAPASNSLLNLKYPGLQIVIGRGKKSSLRGKSQQSGNLSV